MVVDVVVESVVDVVPEMVHNPRHNERHYVCPMAEMEPHFVAGHVMMDRGPRRCRNGVVYDDTITISDLVRLRHESMRFSIEIPVSNAFKHNVMRMDIWNANWKGETEKRFVAGLKRSGAMLEFDCSDCKFHGDARMLWLRKNQNDYKKTSYLFFRQKGFLRKEREIW